MQTILANLLTPQEGAGCFIVIIKSGNSISAQRESKAVIATMRHVKRLRADESGSTAIEYGLIVSAMGFMLLPFTGFFSVAFSDWATTLVDGINSILGG